jgi:hypothetical protein
MFSEDRVIMPQNTVFLVDVDNTLIDNDHIQADLKRHLEHEFGATCRDRYWAILENLFKELGYRDYLGALQRYRAEHPRDIHLLSMSSYLVDYPFANRLYPQALSMCSSGSAIGGRQSSCRMAMSSFSPARSSGPEYRKQSMAMY